MRFCGKEFAIVLFLLCHAISTNAQIRGSGLLVTPTRIELDKQTRSLSLSLINKGIETGTYRIQAINSRMTETGERIIVESKPEPGELFADKLIRYAPRQIRLKPGEQQTVRVMAKIPNNLEEGEYRTGLNFQWIPDPGKPKITSNVSEGKEISVSIQFSYGVTIPVLIRNGDLQASGKISKLTITENKNQDKILEIVIEREGTRSLYGDFSVFYVSDNGQEEMINMVKGVAVYVPNPRRIFTMKLPRNKFVAVKQGKDKLRVEYREQKNGHRLIAESSMALN